MIDQTPASAQPSGTTYFTLPTSEELILQRQVDKELLERLIVQARQDGRVAELREPSEQAFTLALLEATHQHKKGGLYAYVGELPIALTIGEQQLIIHHAVYWHLWPFQRKLYSRPVFEFNQPDRFRQLSGDNLGAAG